MYIGERVPGRLTERLVEGRGLYVPDVRREGMAHAVLLRSPYPHARIRAIHAEAAAALPGVLGVVCGADLVADTDPLPHAIDTAMVGARVGSVRIYGLAVERVRYVGEPVVAVVARDLATALEARERVRVEYEPLPAVVDVERALAGEALVEPEWGTNVLVAHRFAVGDPDGAMASADGVVSGEIRLGRVTGTPLETRGLVAEPDPRSGALTIWASTQNPHPLRMHLAKALRLSENDIRVIQPNVGGSFGLKHPTFPEDVLVPYLARRFGCPVRWVEERTENFQAGGHSRDVRYRYRAAYLADGRVTALALTGVADVGAPTALVGWVQALMPEQCLPGMYAIPNLAFDITAVVTNTGPWNSYRGFGKDVSTFLVETVLDRVAKAAGLSPVEVRKRNFIPPEAFPYTHPTGVTVDSGRYGEALDLLLERMRREGFWELREEGRRLGRRLGVGFSMEVVPEAAAQPGSVMVGGYDGATVRVSPTGAVSVFAGVTSPGTGNETAIAQVVAETLGCRLERVKVVEGDTELCPFGLGNYSGRSTVYGGAAAHLAATDVRRKMVRVAARLLEADPDDVVVGEERFAVSGVPDRFVGFDEVVREVYAFAYGPHVAPEEPALEATRHFRIGNVRHDPQQLNLFPVWSYGASGCLVEVDEETGAVRPLKWCYVHDAGRIVNPLLAEANIRGGLAQGIGGALHERIAYDEEGQPLTLTFMEYTVPTFAEVPDVVVDHLETPSPFTPFGAKGVGESGVGSALRAITSAIEDAFPERRLELDEVPVRPQDLWRRLQERLQA